MYAQPERCYLSHAHKHRILYTTIYFLRLKLPIGLFAASLFLQKSALCTNGYSKIHIIAVVHCTRATMNAFSQLWSALSTCKKCHQLNTKKTYNMYRWGEIYRFLENPLRRRRRRRRRFVSLWMSMCECSFYQFCFVFHILIFLPFLCIVFCLQCVCI